MIIKLTEQEKAKAQTMFNKVFKRMAKQGFRRSTRHTSYGDVCMYRGNYNMVCAAGALIPDKLYTPKMEGIGISFEIVYSAIGLTYEDQNLIYFVGRMQSIHDVDRVPTEMKQEFKFLAREFDLKVPEIGESHANTV